MGQTDNTKADWWNKSLRKFFSLFDRGVYYLLVAVYQVFFNVASAQILQGDTLKTFFSRIQIILGVFVLFKLAINLINVIVNPDQLGSDKSGQGFSQIVVRVISSLVMLVAVMPLSIPGQIEAGSYEENLNNNGLLFGTMYEIQDRVLEQNVLAKLIIGSRKPSGNDEYENLKDTGRQLSSFILKGFIRINLKPGEENEYESKNWMCPDNEDDVKAYLNANITPGELLKMVALRCEPDDQDGKRFVFTYMTPFTTIVGIVFIIFLAWFVIDIAIRAFKLAILRLIAPIPIISYIDPKSQKDGAFVSWTKAVVNTYLGLFLNLAVIFFVIWVIQDIMVHGMDINNSSGMVGILSWIFIILGLFYFAKQAPKFIPTALGIKSMGLGVGLSGALGFMGGFIGRGGFSGAMTAGLTAANTANEAAAQGKAAPPAYSTGRDLIAKMRTGDDKAVGGILNTMQRSMTNHSKRVIGARQLQKRFGITAMESDLAKQLMYQAQDYASDMANLRSDIGLRNGGQFDGSAPGTTSYITRTAGGGVLTDAYGNAVIDTSTNNGRMLDNFVRTHRGEKVVEDWINGRNGVDDAQLMNYMVNTSQTEFQKQKKTYEDSDQMLKKFGNDTTLEEKYATGLNRYIAVARNGRAQSMQRIPGFRNRGRRQENNGIGKGGYERYYNDQGRAYSDQEFHKYGDLSKKWTDRRKK